MRRIFLVATLLVVSMALSVMTASAASVGVVAFSICTPAADSAPGDGSNHNQAPPPQVTTNAPHNGGTSEASDNSPAFRGCRFR